MLKLILEYLETVVSLCGVLLVALCWLCLRPLGWALALSLFLLSVSGGLSWWIRRRQRTTRRTILREMNRIVVSLLTAPLPGAYAPSIPLEESWMAQHSIQEYRFRQLAEWIGTLANDPLHPQAKSLAIMTKR